MQSKSPLLIFITLSFLLGSTASILTLIQTGVRVVPTSQTKTKQEQIEPPHSIETQDSKVSFFAVGDISLSRGIAYSIDKNNDALYPWRNISAVLKTSDFNFGNLETPFSSSDKYTANSTLIFNAPKKNIEGLVKNNFVVVSTANNHALDQGLDGITQTRKWLLENNILPVGTGENLEEAWLPATVTRKGITVGFLATSYASVNDGGKTINDHVARIEDVSNLQSSILNLKYHADFLVASMHAGTEYTLTPNPDQIQFAHAAIDNGADMVIGHHPHWIQDKEVYCPSTQKSRTIAFNSPLVLTDDEKNMGCKPLYYSLGNFIFDQSWSRETTEGLMLKVSVKKTGSSIALESIEEIPIKIQNNCCAIAQ